MKLRFLSLMLVALAVFVGCDKDDKITNPNTYTPTDSTWTDGAGGYNVRLNATTNGRFRYYDLTNRQVVEVSEAGSHSSALWQVAFSRYLGKVNGGASGDAGMTAVDLATIGNPDSVNFDSISTVPTVDSSAWQADRVARAVEGWYDYNPGTHEFLPSHKAYIVKTATGKYAKMEIDSLGNLSRSGVGLAVIKYVYQDDGTNNLRDSTKRVTLDCSNGAGFFSFATGGRVAVGDQWNSTSWDFKLEDFELALNSTINGLGTASAVMSDSSFDDITSGWNGGSPFFQDSYLSVFGSASDHPWFSYGAQHELSSKNHVYLLKTMGGTVFKMQIKNYYMIVDGASQGGWIQFRFKQL